jgi:hypothetical protein
MMLRNQTDRRRVARHAIPGVEATLHTPKDVHVLDVGLYGLAIEVPADLTVESRICLELCHGNDVANVEVAVRWCSVSRMEGARGTLVPVSKAGVEFRDILTEGSAGIWDWICVPSSVDNNAIPSPA